MVVVHKVGPSRHNYAMTTKDALNQWASDAVSLAVCECLNAVAEEMDSLAKDLRGEVWWHAPAGVDWSQVRPSRRLVEGPTRADDSAK